MTILIIILVILALVVLIIGLVIVPQAHIYVVERLGTYHKSLDAGLHFIVPFLDKIARKVSVKEQIIDFPPQPVITKDNVTIQIDTVVFYSVVDAKLFTYGVERPLQAIENLSATTLRNIIGEMELDATLTSRDSINANITDVLDNATDRWGIKVNRVELKNIIPPAGIQEAMEKQMKAERERREKILQAEGEKKSAILVAEGEKQSAILRAEAEKESAILKAEAEKEAMVLRAAAVKEQKMLEAEGEAESIRLVQTAQAEAIAELNESCPSEAVLTLKSLEAFAKAADGKATKIIVPSEIQGIAGLVSSISSIKED